MQLLNQLLEVLTAVTVLILVGVGFYIIAVAVITMARAKAVRWDAILAILVILWLGLVGVRHYPGMLMDSVTDSVNDTADRAPSLRGALRRLIDPVTEPFASGTSFTVGGEPAAGPEPHLPPIIGPEPPPVSDPATDDPEAGGGVPEDAPTETPTPAVTVEPTPECWTQTENGQRVTCAQATAVNVITNIATNVPTAVPTIDISRWNPATPPPTPGG